MEQQEVLKRTHADAATAGIPQPWDFNGTTRESHMADAERQEKSGSRLVVETVVNGYADPRGDGTEWIVDWIDYTDYRTGQHVWGYDPMDGPEPDGELDGLVVVERRLMND